MSLERERNRARFFGFASLFAWALAGTLLEIAHGLKLSAYLDHALRRELLLLAHAHGVGLSLVVLAFAALGVSEHTLTQGKALKLAALLIPLGFALSVVGHTEADPGPAIFLVPLGAVLLLVGLFGLLRRLPRQ